MTLALSAWPFLISIGVIGAISITAIAVYAGWIHMPKPKTLERVETKKYLRRLLIEAEWTANADIDWKLKSKGATAEDVVSVTFHHSGSRKIFTIWYKSGR